MWSDLLEQLVVLDHEWFYKINSLWTFSLFDKIMPIFTDLHKEAGFLSVILSMLIVVALIRYRGYALRILLTCILALSFSDVIAYRLIKPVIKRERPPMVMTNIKIRTERFAGYSFPSNHAANMFALAMVIGTFWPYWKFFVFTIAALIAYSRVYVGVHFPLDVIGGALLGVFCGKLALWISNKTRRTYNRLGGSRSFPSAPEHFNRN